MLRRYFRTKICQGESSCSSSVPTTVTDPFSPSECVVWMLPSHHITILLDEYLGRLSQETEILERTDPPGKSAVLSFTHFCPTCLSSHMLLTFPSRLMPLQPAQVEDRIPSALLLSERMNCCIGDKYHKTMHFTWSGV